MSDKGWMLIFVQDEQQEPQDLSHSWGKQQQEFAERHRGGGLVYPESGRGVELEQGRIFLRQLNKNGIGKSGSKIKKSNVNVNIIKIRRSKKMKIRNSALKKNLINFILSLIYY